MSNLKVHGFKYITFWQEDNIGVIALRSDQKGFSNVDIIRELIMAFGTAAADDDVKAVALTGINNVFLTGLSWFEESQDFLETVDMSHTLVNIMAAMKKPLYALINGDCIDYGYELALLSDYIISTEKAKVGFNSGYIFMAGATATWARYRYVGTGKCKEGINVDRVVRSSGEFLSESKKIVLSTMEMDFASIRRIELSRISSAILMETDKLLRNFYKREKEKQKTEN